MQSPDGTPNLFDSEAISTTVNEPQVYLQIANMDVSTNKVYELDDLIPGVSVYIDRT